MKVVLYIAISSDGFIAKPDGDSDWVTDTDSAIFEQKVKEAGCLVVGKRTFKQFKGEIYPVEGVLNLVFTQDTQLDQEDDNVIYFNTAEEAIKIIKERNIETTFLIGGGITNTAFLEKGLVNEIIFSIHPLLLGEGIKPYNTDTDIQLEFIDSKQLDEDLVQIHYRIKK